MIRRNIIGDTILVVTTEPFLIEERSYVDARISMGAVMVPGDEDPKWCRVVRQLYLGPIGLEPHQLALPAYTRDQGFYSCESGRVDHSTTTLPPMFVGGYLNPRADGGGYQLSVGIKVLDAGTLSGHRVTVAPPTILLDVS